MSDSIILLVIEDEPDGQMVISGLLAYVNIATDTVGTAEEGLNKLNTHQYSGVVIDLALPEMDGFGLISVIRSNPQFADLRCVAVTAFHTSSVKKQAIDAGFNGYFSKPLNRNTFAQDILEIFS